MAAWRSVTTVLGFLLVLAGCATGEQGAEESADTSISLAGGPALIAPFLGIWEGTTDLGSDSDRALAVLIEGGEGDTFSVTWRNWEAVEETEVASDPVTIRETRLDFAPTDDPEVFAWVDNPPADSDDTQATAQLTEGRLVVNITTMTADGRLERQNYVRVVDGNDMTLDYTRWVDEEIRRTLEARLIRTLAE